MPVIALAQEVTPSTQLTFSSGPQAESAQLPATTQSFSAASIVCSAALLPSVGSREVRTIPKPQPKRQLELERSSLSEHIKNRDLQWFKAQQAAARNSNIASPVVDPAAQPGTLVLLNDVAEVPAAEKLKPSRMPGRRYPRPPPSGLITTSQPAAAEIIHRSSTLTRAPAPVDIRQPNEEKIVRAVADLTISDPQPENTPRDSETHPSDAPENIALDVTTSSLKKNTVLMAPKKPPATPSGHVGVDKREFLQANFTRFGGNISIIKYLRGLGPARKTPNITLNFSDSQYFHIAQWTKSKRTKSSLTSDLKQNLCVSFACYHLPSLPSNPLENGALETLIHSPCSWPTSGDLSLQTKRDGKDFIIPLAPPIFVTPDNWIDVSAFIRSGENTFSVIQQNDMSMSDYLFVFLVHHPTSEQLSHLASCRDRREEWVKRIRDLGKAEPEESVWKQSPSEVV